MKKKNKNKRIPYIDRYILFSLFGVFIFYVIPLIESFRYTFTEGVAEKKFAGVSNFRELLTNPAFTLAAANTLRFMAIGVPVLMFFSLFVSFLMSRESFQPVRCMLLIPMVIPSTAYLPGLVEIFKKEGMLNRLTALLGCAPVNYLEDHAMVVLIFVYILKNIGYLTVVISGSMDALPEEYREVWALEKKPGIRYLFRIVIPLIAPTVFFAMLLAMMGCLKIFREAYLLYGQSPPMSVYLLQYFMNNNFYKLNFQRLSSAAFLVILVIVLFIALVLHMSSKVRQEEGR